MLLRHCSKNLKNDETIVKAAVNGVAIDVVNHPFVRFGELVLGEEESVLEVWMKV